MHRRIDGELGEEAEEREQSRLKCDANEREFMAGRDEDERITHEREDLRQRLLGRHERDHPRRDRKCRVKYIAIIRRKMNVRPRRRIGREKKFATPPMKIDRCETKKLERTRTMTFYFFEPLREDGNETVIGCEDGEYPIGFTKIGATEDDAERTKLRQFR